MSLHQDIRVALRLFRRTPGLTAIALLSIAMSVAAVAVVFTAIKAVLITPLPYARPGELVQFRTDFINLPNTEQSHGDWIFWNDAWEVIRRSRTLEAVGIFGNVIFDLAGNAGTPPEALYGVRMTANLFPTLGVSPLLGRNVTQEEDQPGYPNEMILSYGLWTRRFNKDRSIVGRTLKVNGESCMVIGVMPPDFNFPLVRGAVRTPYPYVEFWTPFRLRPADPAEAHGGFGVVARLRPDVTLTEAQQDLAAISSDLSREFPNTNRDHILLVDSLQNRIFKSARGGLWLLMAGAVMFLLIGCVNVANLLLARGLVRQREIAIRMAVGAGRNRILRQFLTESCVLSLFGGISGYVFTVFAWMILPSLAPVSIPRLAEGRADWTVFTFALATAIANGILFGITPALHAIRKQDISTCGLGVRDGTSRESNRIRRSLIVAEVALSVMLVIVGSQLLGNFVDMVRSGAGFQTEHLLASVLIPENQRYPTPESKAAVYRRFLQTVRTLPGVESVGTVNALPFSGENLGGYLSLRESPEPREQLVGEVDVVSAEYLQTMGVRLIEGRWFRDADMNKDSNAVIVDEVAAKHLWPHTSPIGKTVCVNCVPENPRNWKQVIGVVSNIHHASLGRPPQPNAYLSGRAFEQAVFMVVRTNRPTGELEKTIRTAIAAVDPDQPVLLSASMQAFIGDSIADRRFIMTLLLVTACLALLVASAGVYGVTMFMTSRRTQEFGIRMALGATPARIHLLVFRQVFVNVAAGLALGMAATLFTMRFLRGFLDLESIGGGPSAYIRIAILVVLLTTAMACWIPARRATAIDPNSALRIE